MVRAINHSDLIETVLKHVVLRPPEASALFKHSSQWAATKLVYRIAHFHVDDASAVRLQSNLEVFCLQWANNRR